MLPALGLKDGKYFYKNVQVGKKVFLSTLLRVFVRCRQTQLLELFSHTLKYSSAPSSKLCSLVKSVQNSAQMLGNLLTIQSAPICCDLTEERGNLMALYPKSGTFIAAPQYLDSNVFVHKERPARERSLSRQQLAAFPQEAWRTWRGAHGGASLAALCHTDCSVHCHQAPVPPLLLFGSGLASSQLFPQ